MRRFFVEDAIIANPVQRRFPFRLFWASVLWSKEWEKLFCKRVAIGNPLIKPETAQGAKNVWPAVPINFPSPI
jgi:hypothetical protein